MRGWRCVMKVLRKLKANSAPLSGDNSLDEEAEHGEHGESAVLDFLDLELSEGVWVVSQAQGVKSLTRVQGIKTCK